MNNKSIKDMWESFEKDAIPKDFKESTKEKIKGVYYAGAITMFQFIASTYNMDEDEAFKIYNTLSKEAEEFIFSEDE